MKVLIDGYYKRPLIFDFIVLIAIWFLSNWFTIIRFKNSDQANSLSLISSLIGTMISLAGFILAALTIIVTFKSSLLAKGVDDANNALELIFSSRHYKSIVKVFKDSIIEFLIYSLLAYCIWQSYANFSVLILNRIVMSLIISISLNICRSLFMLFSILSLGT